MTPKEQVLKKCPGAECVRDGWDRRAGISGCFDFAIFYGDSFLGQATTPQGAWKEARALLAKLEEC